MWSGQVWYGKVGFGEVWSGKVRQGNGVSPLLLKRGNSKNVARRSIKINEEEAQEVVAD